MTYLFYDLETSGLEPCWDVPLQAAFLQCDADLSIRRELTLRCRLPEHVVPSPDALMVTGVTPAMLKDQPLSHLEMMAQITRIMADCRPTLMLGFNSVRYDDEVVRHSLYQCLLPPYAGSMTGHGRADVLTMLRAVVMLEPQAITIPRDAAGKPVMKLGDVCRANCIGLSENDAHDAELVAFRSTIPDLKFAAREARRLSDEAMRVRFGSGFDAVPEIAVGLTLIGLSFTALTAIWPADNLDVVAAKLALAEAIGPYGDNQDGNHVPALAPATATRIRIKRAAYHVGELMVPAGPAAPSAQDRGLGDWPLRHYDLTTILPPQGGPPVFVDPGAKNLAELLSHAPDLGRLAERIERLIKTADRLFALARKSGDNAMELRRAAEGAQIMAISRRRRSRSGPL